MWANNQDSCVCSISPPPGRPVTTADALWRFPPPPKPQRLSATVTVTWVFLTLTRVIFGVVYFQDCPLQPYIPVYLLGLALMALIMMQFVNFPCDTDAALLQENPKSFKACLMGLSMLFVCIWIPAGDAWVFSVYQSNYDPSVGDGLYCNKTLYTFAFWNAVWETLRLCVVLINSCRKLVCWVMSPTPAGRDVYMNV